ncbi:MAG TPA: DUF1015 domain-containing protein [Dehalococcoidia bacterium]|nr:DUF1015 domain-containing protein [Dehalococcoidia bacterium]
MADFRPFPALRYNTEVAGDASTLVAPPYDVVSPERAAELYARSPFNIANVDYGPASPEDSAANNRYLRARAQIEAWLKKRALVFDTQPRLYVYDQEFTLHGERFNRRAIFGRLRLEEWEKGIVLPHEHTRAAAKADRLELLRATRVQTSPILAMYRSPTSQPLISDADCGPVILDAVLPGERHVLRPLIPEAAAYVHRHLEREKLYVADGHHRYETALAYRNERREAAASWTGEEPENFVLAALVDMDDPGLVILPTHRLVRLESAPGPEVVGRPAPVFEARHAGDARSERDLEALVEAMAEEAARGTALGAIGLTPGGLHLIRVADREAVDRRIPQGHAEAWRRLDVNVLHHALLPLIGARSAPEEIEFTEAAQEAAREVLSGRWDAALLLNPTPVEQVVACALAGERMPQKSTFFYPKLATGVVMYPLDWGP